jgi:hypothetical protein
LAFIAFSFIVGTTHMKRHVARQLKSIRAGNRGNPHVRASPASPYGDVYVNLREETPMPDEPQPPTALNPLSMSVADFARLLSVVGGRRVTPEQVMADLESGAPSLPDGRINLIYFAAWLLQQVQRR